MDALGPGEHKGARHQRHEEVEHKFHRVGNLAGQRERLGELMVAPVGCGGHGAAIQEMVE